jgi:arabinofuranosyltransferase
MIVRTIFQLFGALLVGLLLAALLALAPLVDRSVVLDIGAEGVFRAPDETTTVRRMAGFHAAESADGISYRWTKAWARLVIPNGHRLGDPLWVRLRLCGCHPDGGAPIVQVALDNQPLAELPTSGSYRRYTLLAPPGGGDAGSDLLVELRTPTASFDGRMVGVRVDQIEAIGAPVPAIPWPAALALAAVGALATAAALKLIRDRLVLAALLGAIVAGPMIVLALYQHQELSPTALVLASLSGALLVALARPGRLGAALLLPALCVALPLLPQLLGGWLVDDAFISFRYAQHLVAGDGLVFNPGERVEGYTNFFWTMVIAAVIRLRGDPAYVARLLTLLIAQATIVLCYIVGRRISTASSKPEEVSTAWFAPLLNFQFSILNLIAPLLLATSGPFLLYSARGSGLETALFTLLLLAGVWAYVADRCWLSGALLALTALTRPEGVLVQAITAGHALLPAGPAQRGRRAGAQIGAFLVIFLPYYIWRFAYYGLPLPNTFYVKVGASTAQVLRGLRYLADYWSAEGWAWGLGLLILLIAWAARRRPQVADSTVIEPSSAHSSRHVLHFTPYPTRFLLRTSRFTSLTWLANPTAYLALIVLAYLAYIAAVGGDWLPEARFVVPLIPLFALLAQAGLTWLAGRGRWGPALAAMLLCLAVFDHTRHTLATSAYDPTNLIWQENETVLRRREVGRWLRANTSPGTLVAVEAAGALPYYSQRPALDILGLNDRHIASLVVPTIGQGKPGHEKIDIPYVLARHPDIIPYFSVPYFAGQPAFHSDYAPEEHDGPEGYTIILYRRK